MSTTNACRAGVSKAFTSPWNAWSAITCQTRITPPRARPASAKDSSIARTSDEADEAEHARRARQPIDEPARRDPRDPRADERDAPSAEEEPVVPMREGAEREAEAARSATEPMTGGRRRWTSAGPCCAGVAVMRSTASPVSSVYGVPRRERVRRPEALLRERHGCVRRRHERDAPVELLLGHVVEVIRVEVGEDDDLERRQLLDLEGRVGEDRPRLPATGRRPVEAGDRVVTRAARRAPASVARGASPRASTGGGGDPGTNRRRGWCRGSGAGSRGARRRS